MQKKPDRKKKGRKPASQRSRKKKKDNRLLYLLIGVLCVGMLAAGGLMIRKMLDVSREREARILAELAAQENESGPAVWMEQGAPYIDVELLTPNEYSRPQIPIEEIRGIAIHYTANPGATAMNNRNYFENLKDTHETKVSSHFVVGLEGEVVQCIPTSEISYATNSRNVDTISIECCHPDETGQFNEATYDSVVKLTAWLCLRFGLDTEDVIRHYDVTEKNCPKYYVEHPDAWEEMKADIGRQLEEDKNRIGNEN